MKVITPKFPRRKAKVQVNRGEKLPWYRPKSDKSLEPNYDLMLGEG